MRRLIMGIVISILPIFTWFSVDFVSAVSATLFFWAIGIPLIFIAADRIKPGGIWVLKKKPSTKPPKGHDARVYQFDDNGKVIGHKNVWIKD